MICDLIVTNNFKLEYKSFILSLGLLLFYLIYIRYLRRDMDNLYTKYSVDLYNYPPNQQLHYGYRIKK